MNFSAPTPAIKLSIQRMVCTSCGAEANASCNCGKAYVPKAVRAAETIAANPEKSNRQIADETGADEKEVRRQRAKSGADMSAPESVTGKDGKQYPAKRAKSGSDEPEGDDGRLPARQEIADPDAEHDRKECVALNQKVTEAERELAEASGDELTPEERLEHYRFTLATQAEQAGDLAERFAVSLKECPTALTPEAIRSVYRVVDRWSALLKSTAAAARP
jgi:hypothetical protein